MGLKFPHQWVQDKLLIRILSLGTTLFFVKIDTINIKFSCAAPFGVLWDISQIVFVKTLLIEPLGTIYL